MKSLETGKALIKGIKAILLSMAVVTGIMLWDIVNKQDPNVYAIAFGIYCFLFFRTMK